MKLYRYILLLGALAVTSCDLDEFPQDKLAPENYFNNEAELRTFTNTFYQQNLPTAESIYSETADLIVCTTLSKEVAGTRVVENDGGGWTTGSWNPLTYINHYLYYSHRCKDAKARAHYDGVARFFRAYFYFEKVKRFGDVPWYDTPVGSADPALYKARDSREYVMEKVLEDIDFAIDNLPTAPDVYNVTKWTALALKSRICLFEGTFRKYHGLEGGDEFLQACADASEKFITSSPYDIYNTGSSPYRDLFSAKNATSTSKEVILARDYDKGQSVVHNINMYALSTTYGMPGVTKKMVDSYLMADGTRFTDQPNYGTMGFYMEMQNRDPRLTQTVRGPKYTRIGGTETLGPDFACSHTGYNLTKWVGDASQDGYNNSYSDIILFRSAEVYLNFAEAKAELGTLTQSDIDKSIKKLRDRVGMPNLNMEAANLNPDPYLASPVTGYANVTGANKGVILEIRRERAVELIAEGFRYYYMVRWKEGKRFENEIEGMYFAPIKDGETWRVYDMDGDGKNSAMDICLYTNAKPEIDGVKTYYKIGEKFRLTGENGGNVIVHDTATEPRQWREDRDYLYPIPLSQILLSNGKVKQNPHWDEN